MGGSGVAVGGGAGVALGVNVEVRVGVGGAGVGLGVIVDVTVGEAGTVGAGKEDAVVVEVPLVGVAVAGGFPVALGVGGIAVPVALDRVMGFSVAVPAAFPASGARVGARVGTCQAEQALDSPSSRIRHNVGTRPTCRAIVPPGLSRADPKTLGQSR